MFEDPVDPEDCLRALTAEALSRAHPGRSLFPVSLRLMAVANAFVMLGLLPEPQADAILAEHRSALESKGLGSGWGVTKGELTVQPGAHEYWEARATRPAGLHGIPLSVAAAGVECPTSVAEVCFEWLKLTSAGLQLSFHAVAPAPGDDPPDPRVAMRQAMSEISLTDDAGRSHELSAELLGWGRSGDRQEWHGRVQAAQGLARKPAWLEFTPTAAGVPARVFLSLPAEVPVGTCDPPWPTAAECYLAALSPVTSYTISDSVTESTAGPEDTAGIVVAVADSLMAVGALPFTSTLLSDFSASRPPWHIPLAHRWRRRVGHQAPGFRAGEHRGLGVRLPLEHSTAVIESVSEHGGLVSIQLYGHPWVQGEYWPMITPCFQVRATDDAGTEHEGMPGNWQGSRRHEGSGSFWFWPPVAHARRSLRVTVSTLWEAAWAEFDLPR